MVYLILGLASFCAAVISGSAGFGGSLLLLPAVTACMGAEAAVPALTLAQLIGNLARVSTGWKEIKWSAVGWFCLTAIPFTAMGAFGFSVMPKTMANRVVGAGLILLVVLKLAGKMQLKGNRATLLVGGGITGGLSGLVGSGGPIGAAVFLSLDLTPVAYIASEAATAVAMHVLKTVIYSKFAGLTPRTYTVGLFMGVVMAAGTYAARHVIRNMEKGRYQKYVAQLLLAVGVYMLLFGGS